MKIYLLVLYFIASSLSLAAQQITASVELDNDKNQTMNHLIQGGDNSFYAYRIHPKGKAVSYYIEKYQKSSMKPDFSKELTLQDKTTSQVVAVEYALDNVYIFVKQFTDLDKKVELLYGTVSSTGKASTKLETLLSVRTEEANYVDFHIYFTPNKTKFIVQKTFKVNKDDPYNTVFASYDLKTMKQITSKNSDDKLFSKATDINLSKDETLTNINFIGLAVDDSATVYYSYSYQDKKLTDKISQYKIVINSLSATTAVNHKLEIPLDEYIPEDLKLIKTKNEIIIGGFLKNNIDTTAKEPIKYSILSCSVAIDNNILKHKIINTIDNKTLSTDQINTEKNKSSHLKLDYIFQVNDFIYIVGQLYTEQLVTVTDYSDGIRGKILNKKTTHINYEYNNVIISKINSAGNTEWLKQPPLRNYNELATARIYKQYIAVPSSSSINIFFNEDIKNTEILSTPNYDIKDLKFSKETQGTNFVLSSIALSNGASKHNVISLNDTYCFNPIIEKNLLFAPSHDKELFVKNAPSEIILYTTFNGKDKFLKIKLE